MFCGIDATITVLYCIVLFRSVKSQKSIPCSGTKSVNNIYSSGVTSPSLDQMYCIVLYCIVLYCIVLYCIVLYCIVLYCIVLYCIVLETKTKDHIYVLLA